MTLYVIATPVGNLEDISRRALRLLEEVEVVLAEDTRHSQKLLQAYGLSTPLRSYHDHTGEMAHQAIVRELAEGRTMALISDAGTPCVSDPGYLLVRDAVAAGVEVVPVPGASSVLSFVAASGLPSDRFQFVGFVPRKEGARHEALESWLAYPGTSIFLEAPGRVLATLESLAELEPTREVVLGRELTKRFEEWIRGDAQGVLEELKARDTLRGEFVGGIAPGQAVAPDQAVLAEWARELVQAGVRTKDAARILSRQLGVSVDAAYQEVLRQSDNR